MCFTTLNIASNKTALTNPRNTFFKGFINSYSQLFFADNKIFAWLLLASSFIDPNTGASGAIAALTALLFAWWAGLDRNAIAQGSYSFNALMSGMVLGSIYDLSYAFVCIVICAALLSVLLTVLFYNLLYKYKVPAMSLSFLFTLWITLISIRSFGTITLSTEGLYRVNELYKLGGFTLVEWTEKINALEIPLFIDVYLKSISAIFFQYNVVVGLLMMIGIIIWSRIAFTLSLVGFSIGYLFYYAIAGEFSQLLYSYIGFNFILTAITLGGFFLVPSRASYTLVLLATPLIAVLISGLSGLLYVYQLPLFSLPFNIVVILFMMLLNSRVHFKRLVLVPHQYYSPEKNLYHYLNSVERFKNDTYIHMHLPFFGEWFVSQGYEGSITHKEDWKYALDFVVVDETQKTFKLPGTELTDFYCYNLPVLAPADGHITHVVDDVEDNAIKDINVQQNWGNTIIIKHADALYSKLSHLKAGSISVKPGDYVHKGQIIATCGSSGRSPEPHLHFQIQSTPYIGSKTLKYPLSYFVTRQDQHYQFHSFTVPQEGASVSKPVSTPLLNDAFGFIPGSELKLQYEENGSSRTLHWECGVNAWNQTYIHCKQSDAYMYFVNNGTLFYATSFYGNKKSVLYHFFLATQKIVLGYYHELTITDNLPLDDFFGGIGKYLQDVVAPFYLFLKAGYASTFVYIDDYYHPKEIKINATIKTKNLMAESTKHQYHLVLANGKLASFTINNQLEVKCID